MSPPRLVPRAALVAGLLVAAGVLPGCAGKPSTRAGSAGDAWEAPRRRAEGPRSIPFAGGDPAAKGWVKEEGLLWVESADAAAYASGRVRVGDRYATFAEADALEKTPLDGYLLRTDHVLLRTDVPFARARSLARSAERHVGAVLSTFGDPLDLRLPADPLRVVVAARRSDYEVLLRERVATEVAWNAFYEAADGTVYACDEPKKEGGLPIALDLDHEMVHALLDLGRSDPGRAWLFARPQFWAWEAAAVWGEGLAEPPETRRGSERLARFLRRRAWGETTPLSTLFGLPQEQFVGRHYDETASFMAWLMEADGRRHRAGFFALLREVMAGRGEADGFKKFLGMTPEDAQRRWLQSLDAGAK